LARLRDDYEAFRIRDAEILAVGPDSPAIFGLYWRAERLPFVGLPDSEHTVARLYKQETNILRLGHLPVVMVVDAAGLVRFVHYGSSMRDLPENRSLLEVIDGIRSTPG
jgi:peroxiredoxin Q/BCP